MTFGMCSVVVIYVCSTFKGVLILMYKHLKINYYCLSRGSHRGISVDRYHWFLNRSQKNSGNDRGTLTIIYQNAKQSQYAWNSAPINATDIPRSLAAIGREFRFPLDVEISPTSQINAKDDGALFQYLRKVSNDSVFSLSVLKILIEERSTSHRDRHNKGKTKCALKLVDVVKAHVQVNSISEKRIVSKLNYKAKDPFTITADLGNNSVEV